MAVGDLDHEKVDRKESSASTESMEDSRMRTESESSNDDGLNCLEPLGFDDLKRYTDLSAR